MQWPLSSSPISSFSPLHRWPHQSELPHSSLCAPGTYSTDSGPWHMLFLLPGAQPPPTSLPHQAPLLFTCPSAGYLLLFTSQLRHHFLRKPSRTPKSVPSCPLPQSLNFPCPRSYPVLSLFIVFAVPSFPTGSFLGTKHYLLSAMSLVSSSVSVLRNYMMNECHVQCREWPSPSTLRPGTHPPGPY